MDTVFAGRQRTFQEIEINWSLGDYHLRTVSVLEEYFYRILEILVSLIL